MGERENAKLIDNHEDVIGAWNTHRPNSIGSVNFRAIVLHVEDHDIVARMAKEMLEVEGWQVDTCSDGDIALKKICGPTRYDVLLLDYDLPGVNGLELAGRARKLAHRSQTPIVILSATPVEAAARNVGADVFLQKPHDIGKLVETITRLVSKHESESGSA